MISNNKCLFVIGAQKAGTTWIRNQLFSIKEFSISPIKELHYYSYNENPSGFNWANKHRIEQFSLTDSNNKIIYDMISAKEKISPEEYLKLLSSEGDGIFADFSPEYCLLKEETLEKMMKDFPNSKFVYILRNPVERAISQLIMQNIVIYDLNHLLEIEHISHVIAQSKYSILIKKMKASLGRNLLILNFEHISKKPFQVINKIFDHVTSETFLYQESNFNYLNQKIFSNNPDQYYNIERINSILAPILRDEVELYKNMELHNYEF